MSSRRLQAACRLPARGTSVSERVQCPVLGAEHEQEVPGCLQLGRTGFDSWQEYNVLPSCPTQPPFQRMPDALSMTIKRMESQPCHYALFVSWHLGKIYLTFTETDTGLLELVLQFFIKRLRIS
jgi:hypothetical protein